MWVEVLAGMGKNSRWKNKDMELGDDKLQAVLGLIRMFGQTNECKHNGIVKNKLVLLIEMILQQPSSSPSTNNNTNTNTNKESTINQNSTSST